MGNRKELMCLIEGFKDELSRINEMLENSERDKLLDSFQFARDTRQRFLERFDVD
jgi:prephenate dehydrogenase